MCLESTEFSRQEYWSGLPFPSPWDLPNSGIEPRSPALQADSLPPEPPGKPQRRWSWSKSVDLKLGSRAGLWEGCQFLKEANLQYQFCLRTCIQKKSLLLSVSQPRLLKVREVSVGAWRDSLLYGVCSGPCPREHSDRGLGPMGRLRLWERRRWTLRSPVQTLGRWPVTSVDVGPSTRVSEPPACVL